ncbi:hypothetical protein H257_07230 [Aphanomyces astaci]|uniref:Peptidase A2 domain-containing protein n=1 Tax=Aphanomyces astaci TaxID=112090 RepID=W4GJQ5_APHAT|nr:hypothetical protein H257_07230 [Aphanomyces astaci]ETV79143.1 hypothetical protein H257_07230 [Aphanomyces astaci]|eukprot:XP_009830984.1 hypothetical protein H257_07230 [Aphanomyces astaci]
MDQYEAYMRKIRLANAQRPGGQQVYQMPLSGCIDLLSVERVAFWEIAKPSHELTGEDWQDFCLGARNGDPRLRGYAGSLNMEGFAESEPKLTVDFLMAAIMPPAVQKRVCELMKLYENRSYNKDARAFKNWLAEYMRHYGEFDPLGPYHHFTQKDGKCFKCLSAGHNVFKCPKVADGEARLLMDRAKAIWAEAQGEGKMEKAVTIAKEVKTVEPTLDASFDSGADQSVIPPKTFQLLKDAGRDVVVTDLPTPVLVRGFVGPSHTVTQEVKLTLKFETDVSSLVLANVKCWLFVGNLTAGVGDILLSRPIMHKLGYDPQSMLREAAAVFSEYDMEYVESTSGVVW